MRSSPTSVVALVGLCALGGAALAGCGPTGTDSDQLSPEVVAAGPDLATIPDIQVIEDVTYREVDGETLQLDACLPNLAEEPAQNAGEDAETEEGGLEVDQPDPPANAAIIVVHGGSWTRGDKADIAWRAICQWLASEGYVAFSVNYRLAPAHPYPAAIDDLDALVTWLREPEQVDRFDIDPDRIGAFGGSAGGNLVSLLGTRGEGDWTSGSRVAAVAELSGPIELTGLAVTDDFAPVQLSYLGCASEDDCPVAVEASPFYAIDASDPPFFVAHSTAEMIPLGQAELLVAGLRAAGVPTEFVTVEGTLHATAMLDAELKARIVEFFDGTIGTPPVPVVQGDEGAR